MKIWFKKSSGDLICLAILTIIVCLYFTKLFYPKLSVYNTPDLGLSDVLNVNYSLKEFLSENLKSYQLPLWSRMLQNGFPVLAESQIGSLNLLNIILFFFLQTPVAFNLTYICSFLTAGFSMFIYLRYIKLKSLSALFGSLAFTFSGPLIFQISHTNLLQAASMLPFFFLLTELLLKKPSVIRAMIISFFLSQQLFFGHIQTTFITLMGITFLVVYHLFDSKAQKNISDIIKNIFLNKTFLLYVLAIVLFLILSAPQIIPTFEYTANSTRQSGINNQEVLYTSFAPKMFLTVITPYFWGSPKKADFAIENYSQGIYFWEEIIYYGIFPLIFSLIVIFFIKNNPKRIFFILLGTVSALLMLGKYSPFYIIFSFFPFNNFRFQSRFELLFVFSLTVLSAIGFEYFSDFFKKKSIKIRNLIFILILFITGLDLFFTNYQYQPTETVKQLLKTPETAKYLKAVSESSRVFSIGGNFIYGKIFYTNGFKNLDIYRYFRNDLQADLNLIYKITTSRGFTGSNYFLLRKNLIEEFILENIVDTDPSNIKIPLTCINLLRIYGVDYILTPFKLNSNNLAIVYKTINPVGLNTYYLYKLKETSPRIYFPKKVLVARTFESSLDMLTSQDFLPNDAVLLDQIPVNLKLSSNSLPKYKIVKDQDQFLEIKVKTNNVLLMVLNDTYYPGWKAFVDNQETKIFSANIINRAIVIPKGNHLVVFKFEPISFKVGVIVALAGYLFIVFLVGFQWLSFSRDKGFGKQKI